MNGAKMKKKNLSGGNDKTDLRKRIFNAVKTTVAMLRRITESTSVRRKRSLIEIR
jgi:hypothetical protein